MQAFLNPRKFLPMKINESTVKSKITKILNSEENPIGKSIITWQNQMTKHIKNEWTRTVIVTYSVRPIFRYFAFIHVFL